MARKFDGTSNLTTLDKNRPTSPISIAIWTGSGGTKVSDDGEWHRVTTLIPFKSVRSAYLNGYGGRVRWWWLWRLSRRWQMLRDKVMGTRITLR